MALRLIIQDEEGATTIVPLGEEEITIGREAGNTIQLTEQNVSRQHARLTQGPDGWVLEDLDSYNGIKVNGVPVEAQITLNEGDLVQIGDYHLSLAENVEKTALNLDRPAVAANSNDVGEVLPPSTAAEAATGGATPAAAGAAAMGAASSGVTDSLGPALTAPTSTPSYDDYEDEPKKKGGGMGIVVVLLLAVVAVGGYFAFAGGGDDGGKKPVSASAGEASASGAEDSAGASAGAADDSAGAVAASAGAAASASDSAADESAGEDTADEAIASTGEVEEPEPEPEPEPEVEPTSKKKKVVKKKPPKPEKPAGDPDQLLADARKASLAGNASQAYKLAKQSYGIDKNKEALKLMGVSACKMGDAAKAQQVYKKVDAGTKKALVSMCGAKGVELE